MTTDTDTLVALAALRDEITDEDLHESGRYFHDRSFGDLTRCSHGDTGNFSEDADGKAISLLWNFWRSGGLARIEALEAEVARRSEMHECAMAERDDCILDWSDTKAERDRLAEEVERLTAERDEWRNDFRALEKAIVGDTGLSAMTVAAQARLFRPRAERAEAQLTEARAGEDELAEALRNLKLLLRAKDMGCPQAEDALASHDKRKEGR